MKPLLLISFALLLTACGSPPAQQASLVKPTSPSGPTSPGDPPPTTPTLAPGEYRFSVCAPNAQSYIVDTSLLDGSSTQNVIYSLPNGCGSAPPWELGQNVSAGGIPGIDSIGSTVIFEKNEFTLVLGVDPSTTTYNGECPWNNKAQSTCQGYVGSNAGAQDIPLTGTQLPLLCSTCTYSGIVLGSDATVTVSQGSDLSFSGEFNGLNFVGILTGGTAFIDSANSSPQLPAVAFFVSDPNTGDLYFYDANAAFQGSVSPGSGQ